MTHYKRIIKTLLTVFFSLFGSSQICHAWYDSNAPGTAPDWSYRVPINIPAGAPINSTVKFDVDFGSLITILGVGGSFDINSPRVVRPSEALVSTQEYTDRIFNNVLDPAANDRGQIKFILQEAGPTTYYLYFDTTVNGIKPINPRPTINGDFEHSIGSTPTNWTVSSVNAGGNQNNEVYDTAFGSTFSSALTCNDQALTNVDTSPNNAGSLATTTGRKWHLNGYRNNCEDGLGRENISLSKTFTVPATNAGNMTFNFQLQAFDSWDGASNYDYFKLRVNNVLVNHTSLGINNTGLPLRIATGGIGRRDAYSAALVDAGWKSATLNLTPYAGSTITIMFTTDFFTDAGYRTWVKLDDIEWSIRPASLGVPEVRPPILMIQKTSQVISDGVNITNPKRIPGAIVEYAISTTNSGYGMTDNNSVIINDAIPANSQFIVNSVLFSNGAPSSTLTVIPANITYSTDGIVFNSSQSTATKHIRVSPQGQFAAKSVAGNPSFLITFRVQIQ